MSINTRTVLSELQALNTIVSYCGLPPAPSSTAIETSPDHLMARGVMNEVIEQVCSRGMPCNKDEKYTLNTETDGTILIPEGAISAFPEGSDTEYITERDGKLYDIRNKTFVLERDIDVTIYWLLEFESLPQVVRKYITINSARRFVSRFKGDDAVLATTMADEDRAEVEYLRYVEQTSHVNMFDNPELGYITERENFGYRRR